jgi:hypothetical protein
MCVQSLVVGYGEHNMLGVDLTMAHFCMLIAYDGVQPGDPSKGAQVLVDLVHGTGPFASTTSESPCPTDLVLGSDAFEYINAELDHDLENLERWKDVTLSTDFRKPV